METRVKNMQPGAQFEYIDIFGWAHYHSHNRRYRMKKIRTFGKTQSIIYSSNI